MSVGNKNLIEAVIGEIERRREELVSLSRFIWENPEPGYEEYKACGAISRVLEEAGFSLTVKACGMDTAFIARKDGDRPGPCVAFMAEYDALGEQGHACGHNLFSVSAAGSALALAKAQDETGGSVVVLGTPAEEGIVPNAGGKIRMIQNGVFDKIDAAFICHAEGRTIVERFLAAATVLECTFTGKAAHAGGSSHEGINALSAGCLTVNNINALRQHFLPRVIVNPVIVENSAQTSTIPEKCRMRMSVRAANRETLRDVLKKLENCVKAGALATGCECEISLRDNVFEDVVPNHELALSFGKALDYLKVPYIPSEAANYSWDAGNVSRVCPTVAPYIKIGPENLVGHTVGFKEASNSKEGYEGMIAGAKAMAMTALDYLTDEALQKRVKAEFDSRCFACFS